ncbi:MAG: BioY protein, partial [Desulfacinum sp.]|nr:BioY protein [Desulfacinum sp.]
MPLDSIRQMVLVCLMTALTAVGAQIAVPIGPVPIVLTNLFVLLAGLLLGPKRAAAALG